MIPASEEYGVPGAGDDLIFADILRSFGRDAEHVAAVLRLLDDLSRAVFTDLTSLQRDAVASQLREAGGQSLMYLSQIILQCYYRDDRVMRSLDMELRPPFPDNSHASCSTERRCNKRAGAWSPMSWKISPRRSWSSPKRSAEIGRFCEVGLRRLALSAEDK